MVHPADMLGLDSDDETEIAAAREEVYHCSLHLLRADALLGLAETPEDVETYTAAMVFWSEQLSGARRDLDAWVALAVDGL